MGRISVDRLRRSKPTWDHVTFAASESEPGVYHEIKRRREDGHLGCGCLAYRFKRGEKTCKHLRAYDKSNSEYRPDQIERVVQIDGERFTFSRRRAISIGALP